MSKEWNKINKTGNFNDRKMQHEFLTMSRKFLVAPPPPQPIFNNGLKYISLNWLAVSVNLKM